MNDGRNVTRGMLREWDRTPENRKRMVLAAEADAAKGKPSPGEAYHARQARERQRELDRLTAAIMRDIVRIRLVIGGYDKICALSTTTEELLEVVTNSDELHGLTRSMSGKMYHLRLAIDEGAEHEDPDVDE